MTTGKDGVVLAEKQRMKNDNNNNNNNNDDDERIQDVDLFANPGGTTKNTPLAPLEGGILDWGELERGIMGLRGLQWGLILW